MLIRLRMTWFSKVASAMVKKEKGGRREWKGEKKLGSPRSSEDPYEPQEADSAMIAALQVSGSTSKPTHARARHPGPSAE